MSEIFESMKNGYNQGVSEFESDPKDPIVIFKLILALIFIAIIVLEFNGVPALHYLFVAARWIWHLFN